MKSTVVIEHLSGVMMKKTIRVASVLYFFQSELQKNFHENVEIQTVMFFLYLASREEAQDLTSIGNALGLSKAATSRNFYRLSNGGSKSDFGLELLESFIDPMDYRRKLVRFTQKGKELVELLCSNAHEQMCKIQS